jgi:hypothetical protein
MRGPFLLGDASIVAKYKQKMNDVAALLDRRFNGHRKGNDRPTGFVLLVFPFGEVQPGEARINFISNGADRRDIVALFKELIARFEMQPNMEGETKQ